MSKLNGVPSQGQEILEYLRCGNQLTPMEALGRFGTMRLGARIYELRRSGYPVKTERIKTNSGKVVARYFLERKEDENG